MREAAEGLNVALRRLVEAQDDQPSPTTPASPTAAAPTGEEEYQDHQTSTIKLVLIFVFYL